MLSEKRMAEVIENEMARVLFSDDPADWDYRAVALVAAHAIAEKLAEGENLGWVDKGIRTRTLLGLRRWGLIEQIEPYWRGGRHRITPAGRAYLEGLER